MEIVSTPQNEQWVIEEINFLEANEDDNIMHQSLWDTARTT